MFFNPGGNSKRFTVLLGFASPGKFRDTVRPFLRQFMKPQVEIYDTTLRDGAQGEGINFSVADKLRIAEKLDSFGVHYIEGGWPGSNPKDMEFFAAGRASANSRTRRSPRSA